MFSGRDMDVWRPRKVSSSVPVAVLIVVVVLVLSRHFVGWVSHCQQLPRHTRVSACGHARGPARVCGSLRGLAQSQDSDRMG